MQKVFLKTAWIVILLFTAVNLWSQRSPNILELNRIAEELRQEWKENSKKVEAFADKNNIPVRQELESGRVIQMINVIDGIPVYYTTFNYGAAQTTRADELWEGGSSGLDLTGEGYDQLGEWDAGHVRKSHVEFTDQGTSRVTNMDGESPTHYHSTHVAGTLIAGGVSSNAKGMAYKGTLKAWDWNGDGSEMAAAAADGLEISNHSYGQVRGWDYSGGWNWYGNENVDPMEDYGFGYYDGSARSNDQIAYNAPNYLIVKSAGNDRGEGPGNAGQNGVPEKDGGTDGYDCISGAGVAKNIMTVGAVYQVSNYTGPASVVMSGFSAWGPADDGRIKPDIVGKGVSVYSTMDGHDNDYASLNGTSMSSPNVAGSLALLQQHYKDTHNGEPMLSSTLKGLVIHTADEAGPYTGPDYKFGWGLMNSLRAAELISDDVDNEIIEEIVLEGGDLYMKQIDVADGAELRITICWTDPPGVPFPFELNRRDPMLVNDLDLTLMDAGFNELYPYSLDPDNPSAAPTTNTKNASDNVEMIYVENASGGSYTIVVTHDGWLEDNEQAFSLIITGVETDDVLPDCAQDMISPENGSTDNLLNEYISWSPANNASSYDVYFGTDGGGTETPSNVFNGESIEQNGFSYLMNPSETYYLQVIPRNSLGPAEGCEDIWEFGTMDAISQYPYEQNMLVVSLPDLPPYWQADDQSDAFWQSTNIDYLSSDMSVLCAQADGFIETNFDNWFISPPFLVESGKEYKAEFYYKNAIEGQAESVSLFWAQSPFTDDLTNLIYQEQTSDVNNWKLGSGLIQADYDGIMFLGFHTDNPEGYGLFIDDFRIDYWGAVGIDDQTKDSEPIIYYSNDRIIIKNMDHYVDADVRVYNQLGQLVYEAALDESIKTESHSFSKPGIYIVRLQKDNKLFTQKILIK